MSNKPEHHSRAFPWAFVQHHSRAGCSLLRYNAHEARTLSFQEAEFQAQERLHELRERRREAHEAARQKAMRSYSGREMSDGEDLALGGGGASSVTLSDALSGGGGGR
jgi:hypothetical protein